MMRVGILGIMKQMLFDYTKLGGQVTLETAGITKYANGIPAYDDLLNDEEIWKILSCIRSTWPLHIQEPRAARHSMKLDSCSSQIGNNCPNRFKG